MAFDSLSQKLNDIFKRLRGKGRLTESDVDAAMKEVRMALLEADVNFRVVKQFTASVKERAIGSDVMDGLNPGQQVIKIVDDELTKLMGSESAEISFLPGQAVTVIMMCGLQGAGKTTTAAKLAANLMKKGKTPLLAALDVYRPAAVKQLQVNGEKVGAEVFAGAPGSVPAVIASEALAYAQKNHKNVLILDTAGRLQIDDAMMTELSDIKKAVEVQETLLVVDAMTGQEAVNVAETFNERAGIDGVILTKLDGDTRGGAALSIKAVTGKPIFYAGMGEKLSDLEQFYPDRMASRILGMGDVLTLIDKVQSEMDAESETKQKEMASRVGKGRFDFNDYLESMKQMRKMGGMQSILGMLPGMGIKASDLEGQIDEKKLSKTEAIVLSMTPAERADPKLLTPQRKYRIAKGSGNDIADVNRFVKQFDQMQKMMKQMGGMKKHKHGSPFGGMGGIGGLGSFGAPKF